MCVLNRQWQVLLVSRYDVWCSCLWLWLCVWLCARDSVCVCVWLCVRDSCVLANVCVTLCVWLCDCSVHSLPLSCTSLLALGTSCQPCFCVLVHARERRHTGCKLNRLCLFKVVLDVGHIVTGRVTWVSICKHTVLVSVLYAGFAAQWCHTHHQAPEQLLCCARLENIVPQYEKPQAYLSFATLTPPSWRYGRFWHKTLCLLPSVGYLALSRPGKADFIHRLWLIINVMGLNNVVSFPVLGVYFVFWAACI